MSKLNAKQKHPGCKNVRGQSEGVSEVLEKFPTLIVLIWYVQWGNTLSCAHYKCTYYVQYLFICSL